jgi:hypothetical protein
MNSRLRYDITNSTFWDDAKFPVTGDRIDTSSGRLDYDYDKMGVGFQNNARYPEEPVAIIAQMSHAYALGTPIRPHLHWIQEQADVPNWLMEYRIWPNGEPIPSFSLQIPSHHIFTYTSGSILQITTFPEIDMSAINKVSAFLDIKIFRDTANSSGLFTGADPIGSTVVLKEYDHHFLTDSPGSVREFVK